MYFSRRGFAFGANPLFRLRYDGVFDLVLVFSLRFRDYPVGVLRWEMRQNLNRNSSKKLEKSQKISAKLKQTLDKLFRDFSSFCAKNSTKSGCMFREIARLQVTEEGFGRVNSQYIFNTIIIYTTGRLIAGRSLIWFYG